MNDVHSGCAGIWFQTIEQLDAWVKDFFCRKHFLKMDVEIVEPPKKQSKLKALCDNTKIIAKNYVDRL